MTANFAGIAAVGASVVAFVVMWNVARKRTVTARLGLFLLFLFLSIPSLLFAAYYAHVLPEAAWFYTLRSWSGSEFLAVFPGCAGGCFAAFLPNLLMAFPLFGVIAVTSIPYLKPFLSPLPDKEFSEQWKDGVCLQSTLSTCGPASVCTILKFLGTDVSERQTARAAFSYTGGTEAWYLARYARGLGYTPLFSFRDGFSPDMPLPAVVGVRVGGMGHFIAVLAINGDDVTFADPMKGLEHLSVAQLRKRYSFTGFCLSITKS